MLMEGHSLDEEKWTSEIDLKGADDFFYYEANE